MLTDNARERKRVTYEQRARGLIEANRAPLLERPSWLALAAAVGFIVLGALRACGVGT